MNSNSHVARLVERRRHCPHSITQVHCPQQEEKLSCKARKSKKVMNTIEAQGKKSLLCSAHAGYTGQKKGFAPTEQPLHSSMLSWSWSNGCTTQVYRKIPCSIEAIKIICNSCGCILWALNKSPCTTMTTPSNVSQVASSTAINTLLFP